MDRTALLQHPHKHDQHWWSSSFWRIRTDGLSISWLSSSTGTLSLTGLAHGILVNTISLPRLCRLYQVAQTLVLSKCRSLTCQPVLFEFSLWLHTQSPRPPVGLLRDWSEAVQYWQPSLSCLTCVISLQCLAPILCPLPASLVWSLLPLIHVQAPKKDCTYTEDG